MPAQRGAALAITMVASACVALAGCSSGSGSPAASSPAAAPSSAPAAAPSSAPAAAPSSAPSSAAAAAAGAGTPTGKFCTDLKNLGTSIALPADARGSLSEAKHKGVQYLSKLGQQLSGLSAQAPPQVASSLTTLASQVEALAGGVATGGNISTAKIEQQLHSITSSGTFSKLASYVAAKCG